MYYYACAGVCMCGGVLICTEIRTVSDTTYFAESRLDQEEGGELDSHEEARTEEIKSREVVLG